MIQITDTTSQIPALFPQGRFDPDRWTAYANGIRPGFAAFLWEDLDGYWQSGDYTFQRGFLPLIQAVYRHPGWETLRRSFDQATNGLSQRVKDTLGRELSLEIILYLGLGNSAGWVTQLSGQEVILLGVEKILELGWQDLSSLYGLLYHELGHAYHQQHGLFSQETSDSRQAFVWQLFTEGVAMYIEQRLVGDLTFYHQDTNGWKAWCDAHFPQILGDFHRDLPTMTRFNQRYFGDWCDYCGHGDTGYYLGARFVQELARQHSLDEILSLDLTQVLGLYEDFYARFGQDAACV